MKEKLGRRNNNQNTDYNYSVTKHFTITVVLSPHYQLPN